MKQKSVGQVQTKFFNIDEELHLKSGQTLNHVTIAYETYGELNKEKNNAILVCHALTGDAHAAGWHEGDKKPGWWEIIIGPGKALDTNKYFIISSNVLGGCKGTTGPASINPETNKEYGLSFPFITISDMVHAQKKLVDSFGIKKLLCVIGGSMGGMQVLQWAVDYPDFIKKIIPIATTARSTPQQIAFNEVARQSIVKDSNWNGGDYYDGPHPEDGLSVARMIAHITYLSEESMYQKFGRDLQDKNELSYNFDSDPDFQVESYLHHQGETFVKRFDANSYLYVTKAIDYFDLADNDSLVDGLKNIKAKTQLISIDSDWLYTTEQSAEILKALQANGVDVNFTEITSSKGHDAFFIEAGQLNYIIGQFLSDNVVEDLMETNIPTLNYNGSLKDAAKLMLDEHLTHIPIVKNNKLIGIITSWDLSKAIAINCSDLKEVMTTDVQFCTPDEAITDIANQMKKYDISSMPVVNDNLEVVGLISTDLISHLVSNL
ncbi:MAG: homoserine O-acetyltransferase [Methanobrevibacter sp.]